MTQPLIINQFDQAIADSPHKGFGLMRNVDLDGFPGAVKVKNAPSSLFITAFAGTFTGDASTEICTVTTGSVPQVTGTAVVLTTTGTLPAGLSLATVYFLYATGGVTFKLATTLALAEAGTPDTNITDAGSGVHTATSINPGTINHIVKDPRSSVRYFQDSNGRVWFLRSGENRCYLLLSGSNTISNASGNGMVAFLNSDASATYLFAFRNALIDVINVFADSNRTTPSWTSSWQTMNTGAGVANRHHAVVGQDNLIYYTDARYIGSIRELTVFVPGTGATYTYNSQALDTPSQEILSHLDELGTDLLAAGLTYNKIYPWDRSSDSYRLPITVPENQIYRIKNMGGTVYILAGQIGNVYRSTGTYATLFKKIPDQLINNASALQSNIITWGGIDAVNGNLLFGMGVQTSGNSGAYLLYPDGRLIIDRIPSASSTNATAFEVTNNFYYMGYASGADELTTSRYSSFQTIVQSGFYKVATKTEKAEYSVLEIVIAKPATTGNVRISYRVDTSSSFTTIDSFTADSTNTTFKNDAIGLIDIENIQIQAEIDGNMELVEIRLIP